MYKALQQMLLQDSGSALQSVGLGVEHMNVDERNDIHMENMILQLTIASEISGQLEQVIDMVYKNKV